MVTTQVEDVIRLVRGVLDSDLAVLYGVETRAVNQAVLRNPERFPPDFAFQLTEQEVADLRSQSVISNAGRGGRRYQPWAFTEQGFAMLSGVLRSPTAVRVNIAIIRAFVRLRQLLATPGDLATQIQQLAETIKLHDHQIRAINDLLNRMLTVPPAPPRRPIGFRVTDPPPDPSP